MPCKNCYPSGKCSRECTYELPQKLERPQLQGGRVESDISKFVDYLTLGTIYLTGISLIGFMLFVLIQRAV